jgi:hypothetical protein
LTFLPPFLREKPDVTILVLSRNHATKTKKAKKVCCKSYHLINDQFFYVDALSVRLILAAEAGIRIPRSCSHGDELVGVST